MRENDAFILLYENCGLIWYNYYRVFGVFSECTQCQGTTYQAAPCSSTQDTICIGQFSHTKPLNINLLKIKGHLSIDKTCFSLLVQNTHLRAQIQKFFRGGASRAPILVLTPSPPSRFTYTPTPETFTGTSRRSRGTCQLKRHFINILCKLLDDIYSVSIHI